MGRQSKVVQALLSHGLPPKAMAQFVRAAHCQQRFLVCPQSVNGSTDSSHGVNSTVRNEIYQGEQVEWHWKAQSNSILLAQTGVEWGNSMLALLEDEVMRAQKSPNTTEEVPKTIHEGRKITEDHSGGGGGDKNNS